jgi:O-antigen/teichoic acid export membrane protein
MTEPSQQSVAQLRHSAVRGVVSLVSRNVAVRFLGLIGSVVIARLLTPTDFGTIALGLTVSQIGLAFVSGGVTSSLARAPDEPERADLKAALAFQVGTMLAFVAVASPICLAFGTAGAVCALMIWSLPIDALRVAPTAMAMRHLNFGPLARTAIIEAVVVNAASIVLVVAGFGVWGIVIANLLRSVTGTVILTSLGSVGWLLPRWNWGRLRRHFAFGASNQAVVVVNTARDQGLNIVIGAVGGLAVLGFWSLAYRMLQIVLLVMQAVWQVAFPAIARLLEAGQSATTMMSRGVRLVAVVTGFAAALLGGAAPALVPVLFGSGWDAVPALLALGAMSLTVSGPITTLGFSFLWAVGSANAVLRAVIIHTVTWLVVAAGLLTTIGSAGVGIAMLIAAFVVRLVLLRDIRRHIRLDDLRLTLPPALLALIAGGAGWFIAESVGNHVIGLALSTTAVVGTYACGAGFGLREDVRALVRLLRSALERSPSQVPATGVPA